MLGARRLDPSHTNSVEAASATEQVASSLLRRFGRAARDAVEVGELGLVGGLVDEVADQVDGAELGIGHVEAGGVRQEVEHGAMLD